ncbi:MAG: sigma-70 family RNA polymerase sigma factor [Actinomycetota bacterium]|nr:sigma-70 family RNA polymerase sigma factor [Actinomycetota bacterium]
MTTTARPRLSTALADDEVMADVSAGSDEAFGVLYDRYASRAYRVAFAVSREDSRAQDAVQEAFLSIWKRRTSYRPQRGSVAAWLLTVVHHRAIDLARLNGKHAAARTNDAELQAQPGSEDVAETAIRRDVADRLMASLALLPDEQQEVITLAYYGQLSHTEIAAQLGLPPGTVKGRMRLGLGKLQHTIAREHA